MGAFTLAAAIRTPFAVPLLASLLHLLGGWLLAERAENPPPRPPQRGRVLAAYALGGAALAVIFMYNEHLARAYGGSMFLARPLPFHSWADAWETTQLVAEKWGLDLLSRAQWAAWLAVVLAAVVRHAAGGRRGWPAAQWPLHGLLLAGGGGAYYLLMGPQYIDHDYYFIDSLLLPLALGFAGSLAGLPWPTSRPAQWAGAGLAAALAGLWLAGTLAVQARRYTPQPDDQGYATLQNFTGAARLLDGWGVARTARITVLDAHTYNLPLLLMQRRGWTVLTTSEANLRQSFDEPADFVITQNAFFRAEILQNYPGIRQRMDSVRSDGYLTLWRPRRAAAAPR